MGRGGSPNGNEESTTVATVQISADSIDSRGYNHSRNLKYKVFSVPEGCAQ